MSTDHSQHWLGWSGRWESNIRYIYEKAYKNRIFCSNAPSSAIGVRIYPSRGATDGNVRQLHVAWPASPLVTALSPSAMALSPDRVGTNRSSCAEALGRTLGPGTRHAGAMADPYRFLYYGAMKTTLDLDDELVKLAKAHAACERKSLRSWRRSTAR
jgi:hypothetical protein